MVPFDTYELHLFRLVSQTGSFTRAARLAGLTQSAVTRQIQGMEARLEIALFERTTRRVQLTEAGRFLHDQSARILGEMTHSIRRLREEFAHAPKTVAVGVSRTVGLAYLPGFFVEYQRRFPQVQLQVGHRTSLELIAALEAREIDVALLCPPDRLTADFRVAHRFTDDFTLIVPADHQLPTTQQSPLEPAALRDLLGTEARWLLPDRRTNTGRRLRAWMEENGLRVRSATELDSFDLIIALVGLGMGVAMVPHRALPLYLRQRKFRRVQVRPRFSRELVVLVRQELPVREHVRQFVERILF
ncbi:MAG: LysR family transcriptional regulator [Rhodospirillales bacterium]|nr:LysR family transcriptional regulator [Acetobacter sp.]